DPLALAVAAEPLDQLNGPRSTLNVEDPRVPRVIQLGDELLVLLPHALRYDGFSRLEFIPVELDIVLHSLTEPVTLRTPWIRLAASPCLRPGAGQSAAS